MKTFEGPIERFSLKRIHFQRVENISNAPVETTLSIRYPPRFLSARAITGLKFIENTESLVTLLPDRVRLQSDQRQKFAK